MQTITTKELVEMFLNCKGASPITIFTYTKVRMNKTGNPYHDKIFKLSEVNGFCGFNYESSVNRQLNREGKEANFVAEQRKWGKRINSYVVENKGQYYISIKVEHTKQPIYFYENQGRKQPIEKKNFEQFIPEVKQNTNQGTEKEIIYRDYLVDNIQRIHYNNDCYQIVWNLTPTKPSTISVRKIRSISSLFSCKFVPFAI